MLLCNKVIGTCAYMGGIPALLEEFVWSWSQMVQYNAEYLCAHGEVVHYDHAKVSYHSFARNVLVDRMLGEWLLMLDTDHQFEPDLCVRLLHRMQGYNLEVVTGIYQYKSAPHSPVICVWDEKEELLQPIGDWDQDVPILPIASAGAGCLLVKRSVFQRIKEELQEGPFDIEQSYSEDHSFFRRLKRLGIQAYCDVRIETPHLRAMPVTMKDYDRSVVEIAPRQEVMGYR